jgi:AraC-like DNA-binding protein
MPLAQLTRLLGYSEQSSLSRSCVRWFGRPPRQLRHGAALGSSRARVTS